MCGLLLVVALLLPPLAGSGAAAPGNAESAQRCQGDGYTRLVREDGTPFQNPGECVRFAAHGGVPITAPVAVLTITDVALTHCDAELTVSNLVAGGSYRFVLLDTEGSVRLTVTAIGVLTTEVIKYGRGFLDPGSSYYVAVYLLPDVGEDVLVATSNTVAC